MSECKQCGEPDEAFCACGRGTDGPLAHSAGSALRGLKWKAVINGRKCINGARYSATITGEIEASEEWSTIYDVMHDLAEHLEANNREMELPDSFQITLYPPNTPAQPTQQA